MSKVVNFQPVTIGLDMSCYTPFKDNGMLSANVGAIGSSVIVKQINGKGFLNSAYMYTPSGSLYGQIKITIDGVVIVYSTLTISKICGLINQLDITSAVTPNAYDFNGNISFALDMSNLVSTYGELGSTSVAKTLFCINSIPFKTSLLIEFISNNTTSKNIIYNLSGLVKTS